MKHAIVLPMALALETLAPEVTPPSFSLTAEEKIITRKRDPATTNNKMEMSAAIKALEAYLLAFLQPFYSDSSVCRQRHPRMAPRLEEREAGEQRRVSL
jgi:ribonuclease HI